MKEPCKLPQVTDLKFSDKQLMLFIKSKIACLQSSVCMLYCNGVLSLLAPAVFVLCCKVLCHLIGLIKFRTI
jgi:hypothetical protein